MTEAAAVRSQLVLVLPDEHTRALELADFYAARIEPKQASKYLHSLSANHDLTPLGFGHLKRIKKADSGQLYVLLCCCEALDEHPTLLDFLGPLREGLVPERVTVPRFSPKSVAQRDEFGAVWPVIYFAGPEARNHPDTLSDAEALAMHRHMTEAVEVAKSSASLGQLAIGCVIVDPTTDQVVASAGDERGRHPLKHCSIVCIDAVAWAEKEAAENGNKGGYLCTGYDLFITREPCVMCAMALVHSRVRRVIYGARNAACGGLGSMLKLHSIPSLNHHYVVYSGLLSSLCQSLLSNISNTNSDLSDCSCTSIT